jgi:hypothetical protein
LGHGTARVGHFTCNEDEQVDSNSTRSTKKLFDILIKNCDNRNVINEIVVAISRDTSHVKQPNESSTQCSNPALRTKNKLSGVGGVAKPSL